jgi:hypothetical protein
VGLFQPGPAAGQHSLFPPLLPAHSLDILGANIHTVALQILIFM